MKLIVGLGNPGKEYKQTRHNVGFMCAEKIRALLEAPPFKFEKKFNALVTSGTHGAEKIILACPQTFMNASGESVQKLVNFYKCAPGDLWLIYDDIDLQLGKIRIRPGGTAGTHNGMKSVIASLGFNNFPRVRIGIESRGLAAPKEQEISSFVLEGFRKEEKKVADEAIASSAEAVIFALGNEVGKAMEKYN